MHQQLAAAARTDLKTGLLNATAWQHEADAEVARALRASADRMSVSAADTRIRVTVSIGMAVLGQHGHDLFE
jgi:GGDEF domain-containing protein